MIQRNFSWKILKSSAALGVMLTIPLIFLIEALRRLYWRAPIEEGLNDEITRTFYVCAGAI